MRTTNTLGALAVSVGLSGCCNGPVAYVDCTASGIQVNIVDDLGDPALAEAVTFHYKDRGERYADCLEEVTDDQVGCNRFAIPWRGEGKYTIRVWSGGQIAANEVVKAVIPERDGGQCCSDVFHEELTVEVPDRSTL